MTTNLKSLLLLGITALSFGAANAQWVQKPIGTTGDLEALYFINATTGYTTGGWISKLYKTTDGGETWTAFSNHPMREIHFVDANTAYGSSHTASSVGTMQKSVNGGTTFTGITAPNSSSFLGVFATSPTTAYFINTENKIIKTSNGGSSISVYSLGSLGSGNQVTDIVFTNTNTGYVTALPGAIFKTTNAGASWTQVPYGVNCYAESISFVNENVGYVGGSKILKTTDAGATWTNKSISGVTSVNAIKFFDANNGLAVGLSGRIHRTADGGDTWVQMESGTTKHLRNVFYLDANTAIVVGDDGTLLKNSSVLGTDTPEIQDNFTFYPNPVTGTSVLSVANAGMYSNLTVEIYNVNGQLVKKGSISGNEYTLTNSELQSGIYIMQVNNDDKPVKTIKLVIE